MARFTAVSAGFVYILLGRVVFVYFFRISPVKLKFSMLALTMRSNSTAKFKFDAISVNYFYKLFLAIMKLSLVPCVIWMPECAEYCFADLA